MRVQIILRLGGLYILPFSPPPPSPQTPDLDIVSRIPKTVKVGVVVDDLFLRRAGGQWRSHAKAHETELQGWDAETYGEWMGTVRRGEGRDAGLGVSWGLFIKSYLE